MSRRLLLCTDLDRTLIPNGEAPESPDARELFTELAAREEVTLTYVSGRDPNRIRGSINEYGLPKPDHAIADVGTSIFSLDAEGNWIRDHRWDDEIGRDWNGAGSERLAEILQESPALELQEPSRQSRFKLSFYVPSRITEEEVLRDVRTRLASLSIPVTVVYSYDEPRGLGLLDILPEAASKLHAIEFLRNKLRFDLSETVFCGDSGNDLSVLASSVPGVLVANASDEVQRQARDLAENEGNGAYLYVSKGSFLGLNGNYAAGVLEGVCHYHPYVLDWLSDCHGENQA